MRLLLSWVLRVMNEIARQLCSQLIQLLTHVDQETKMMERSTLMPSIEMGRREFLFASYTSMIELLLLLHQAYQQWSFVGVFGEFLADLSSHNDGWTDPDIFPSSSIYICFCILCWKNIFYQNQFVEIIPDIQTNAFSRWLIRHVTLTTHL